MNMTFLDAGQLTARLDLESAVETPDGQGGVPPGDFWALSLRELAALGGAMRPVDGFDRTALAALMRRWPDEQSA